MSATCALVANLYHLGKGPLGILRSITCAVNGERVADAQLVAVTGVVVLEWREIWAKIWPAEEGCCWMILTGGTMLLLLE